MLNLWGTFILKPWFVVCKMKEQEHKIKNTAENFSNSISDQQVEKWHLCFLGHSQMSLNQLMTQLVCVCFSVILWPKFLKLSTDEKKNPIKPYCENPPHKNKNGLWKCFRVRVACITCSLAGFFMRGQTVTTNWWHRLCTTQVHTNMHTQKHTQLIRTYNTINLNTDNVN